jgi:hypothetical protein
LPWALPDSSFVGSLRGSLIVPPKQALVRVYFDHGDIYAPIYTTKIPEKKYKSEHIKADYPDTLLFFETDNGDYFTINRKKALVTFHAAGGALLTIDNKGNITIDTTEADAIYGGALKIDINGDAQIKSIGNITIDALGTGVPPPMVNPFEIPDPTSLPRVPSTSKFNVHSTGNADILALGVTPLQPDPLPDPKDPVQVQIAAMSKLKSPTASINIIAALGDINLMAVAGSIKATASVEVDVIAPIVNVQGAQVNLGTPATDYLLKSNAFASFFDTHIHPTPSGPSTPPTIPMASQLPTLVSPIVKTA